MPEPARGPAPDDRRTGRVSVGVAGLSIALLVALVAGFLLGRVVGDPSGPGASAAEPSATADHSHAPGTAPHDDSATAHSHGGGPVAAVGGVSGLAVSDAGFRLEPESTTFTAGRAQPLRFQILDVRRQPVKDFAVLHDKRLHLIVARRDLSGFQHVHPEMAPDGTWSVPLTLPAAGVWRAYADFTATGADGAQAAAVLGVDLTVTGEYLPRPLPAPAPEATAGGFQVRYEGRPRIDAVQPLLFRVTRGGAAAPVERYLGAYGHLVVLREGDLAYVHVHPEAELTDGAVKFWLTAPSPGRYRMFFDFQVAGAVHTAEFTLAVG